MDDSEFKEAFEIFADLIKKYGLLKATDKMFELAEKNGGLGLICTNNEYERELEQERVRILTRLHEENLKKKEAGKKDAGDAK